MPSPATAPRYYSTRDPAKALVSFEAALLRGLAPDGGLYLPDAVPLLPRGWREAGSLAELGTAVLGTWLAGEIPGDTLEAILWDALSFPVPLEQIGEGEWVLELFHGPTRSFKDVGARSMARLMQHFLAARGERRIILVATSGDTGSAVADGFAGMDAIQVVLLYPEGKVSAVQERQLIAARPGVSALAVAGDFDDCQRLVKAAFLDPALRQVPLSSANSINIGRLLPQMLYYLWALRGAAERVGTAHPVLSVPSGNLGNLTAAVLADAMGAEVEGFVAAHNANHFFPDFLERRVPAFAFHPTVPTLSNAMDVGSPSNFERLYHLLPESELRERIWGTVVDDAATRERMRRTFAASGYVACPHTAVGLEALCRYREASRDATPAITVATAHPAKFPEAVAEALDVLPPTDPELDAFWLREVRVTRVPPTLDAIREVLLEL